jgi:hypothetical protein
MYHIQNGRDVIPMFGSEGRFLDGFANEHVQGLSHAARDARYGETADPAAGWPVIRELG